MTPGDHQKAAELFARLSELPESQLASALDAACDGDAALKEQVANLLEGDRVAAAGSFLRGRAIEDAARLLVASPAKSPSSGGVTSSLRVGPLPPGTRLGPYEIGALLGAGGMGEVYRAQDGKLHREVAIKVLRPEFANDSQFMIRLECEAKVLASLNHQNIATVYGLEDSLEDRALVMELVEGSTLAERIATGPIPWEDAVEIARQMAEALEVAHEKGVVHRDLKPANIKVTPEGLVKVLDFGLAKPLASPVRGSSASSPALGFAGTEPGIILGTASYMAPEQARGKLVDRRADIWAFGVVMFEMLTGKPLFTGDSVAGILASVLKDDPELDRLPASTPPAIRRLIGRCLNRDPRQRLQAIGEARIVLSGSLENPLPASPTFSRTRPGRVAWALSGVLTLALILSAVRLYNVMRPPPLRPLIRVDLDVNEGTPLARAANGNMLAVSPDGARIALTLRGADGKVRLYTRLLNQAGVTPLAGTENAGFPFFSPDNQWIGFFADGRLRKIAVRGGSALTLSDAPWGLGGSWGDDGNIIAAMSASGVLSRIPSAGGTPVPVTQLNPGEATHRWPQVLPGSQAVLFTASSTLASNYDHANIDVISLRTGVRKTVVREGFSARYVSSSGGTGHLIYLHQNTLFAVPFDLARLSVTGSAVPILEDVSSNVTAGGDFAVGPNGTFLYLSGKGTTAGWSISLVDSFGKAQPLVPSLGAYYTPRFSPDGKRLALAINDGKSEDIWVKDLDRDTLSRLTFLPGGNRWPVWTPDGENIVFQCTNPAASGLYWIRSDGSGEAKRLTDDRLEEVPYSFSPDGKRLAFTRRGNGSGADIFTAPVQADPARGAAGVRLGKAALFVGTLFNETSPTFSPDGRWLAYVSRESGIPEVYVRPFPGPGGRWQVSTGGGRFPLWSRDGRELLFETGDYRVMAVEYTAKRDSFAAGKARVWTETRLRGISGFSKFDLAPDGKRLVAMLADDANGARPPTNLTFLLNFQDELRRRAPASR